MTLVNGAMILAGNTGAENALDALEVVTIIGALPFEIGLVLMCISLGKTLSNNARRESKVNSTVISEPSL